jgi:hypothetical protein
MNEFIHFDSETTFVEFFSTHFWSCTRGDIHDILDTPTLILSCESCCMHAMECAFRTVVFEAN